MPQEGSGHATETNPLGLALSFVEGAALVTLQDHGLGAGVNLSALELELAEVEFPLDLEGGAEEFQRRSTRLVHMVLEVNLNILAEHLQGALQAAGRTLHKVRLAFEGTRLVLEGELGPNGAAVAAEVIIGPSEEGVEVHLCQVRVFGQSEVPALALGKDLEVATRDALTKAGCRSESVVPRGPWVFTLDPVGVLLWALLPANGWKVPLQEGTPIRSVAFTSSGMVQIVAGESKSGFIAPAATAITEAVLLGARAREDQDSLQPAVEAQVSSGALKGAFEVLQTAFQSAGGDRLFEQTIAVGVADPELDVKVGDLISDRLQSSPDCVPALLARAALAQRRGDFSAAQADFEHAARELRRDGLRRRAGLAYRAAAQHVEVGTAAHARLLEETIALRPDDVLALEGLVHDLPLLGRASAAVRAARRLASLVSDTDVRVRAHMAAARLLLEQVEDPAGAKREWEKALRLAPEEPQALEGLAQTLIARGDTKRAATILDKLVVSTERSGDVAAAAQLCIQLGDLWQPLDAEAAQMRYRRAHELMPSSARPILALARAAEAAGDHEGALEVLDAAVPHLEGVSGPGDETAIIELHLLAGQLYAGSSDRDTEAVAQLEAVLQIDPDNEEALVALTALHVHRKDPTAAAEVLGRRADRAVQSGDPDAAAQMLKNQLQAAPDDKELVAAVRVRVEAALDRHRSHRQLLDLLVQVSEADGPAHIEALDRRLLLDDTPERRAELWTRLGVAFELANNTADAIRAYEEAITASPTQRAAAAALVSMYRARTDEGRLEKALGRAADLADTEREQAELHMERAGLLQARGELVQAWSAISCALKAAPDDLVQLTVGTEIALAAEMHSEARGLIERRLSLHADAPAQARLSSYLDLIKVEELAEDRRGLLRALERAHEAADEASEVGRGLAARFAVELEADNDFAGLAVLQTARGEVETASKAERAEYHLDAARNYQRIERWGESESEVKAVLDLSDQGGVPLDVADAALEVLDEVAHRQPDPGRRARVLVLRAQRASGIQADALRVQAADLLHEADRSEAALAVIEDAGARLAGSPALLEKSALLNLALGRVPEGVSAFVQAAELALEKEMPQLAIASRGQAAAALAQSGDPEGALQHDRVILGLSALPEDPWLEAALTRLEAAARTNSDSDLLAEVLGRRAETAAPIDAAQLLFDKASLHLEAADQDKEALQALRRAHSVAPVHTEISDSVSMSLQAVLQRVGLYAEQASVLSDWAEHSEGASGRAQRLFMAAEVYAHRLRDRSMALSRAQAAVRADPQHEAARSLRIALLRQEGRTEALAEALSEEAALSQDAEVASARWLEAAELFAPPHHVQDASQDSLTKALDLVRRASTAVPTSVAPVEGEVRYSRALGRPDEELSALGRLVDRELGAPQMAAARLRRAHLLRGAFGDDVAAQPELQSALDFLLGADEAFMHQVLDSLPVASKEAYLPPDSDDLTTGTLFAQLDVTASVEDWPRHVQTLMSLVERTDLASERADLRVQAGEILEWRLGDGAAAEREYLTALATEPAHAKARTAVAQFYTAVDRFADLGESLGVAALTEVYAGFSAQEPPHRVAAAAEALWPLLAEGGAACADVQLRLAEIYAAQDQDDDVVHTLELVVQHAPRAQQNLALTRLRKLFKDRGHDDLYVDVLRRQAEIIETNEARAVALAELGEALEWKMGDGPAAELEYRAALAADSTCELARRRLTELLSAQDRFSEVTSDLGPTEGRKVVDGLLELGPRDRERAFEATTALAEELDGAGRGALWLDVAQALEDSAEDETARTREALQAASECEATRSLALQKLCILLQRVGDLRDLAEVLSTRAEGAEDTKAQVELLMQQAALSDGLLESSELSLEEAEIPLRKVLEVDSDHGSARTQLVGLLSKRGQWAEVGALAGTEALQQLQDAAEQAGDSGRVREILEARVNLVDGPQRAMHLVELVAFADTLEAEALYRQALDTDPDCAPAQEGLRALFESQARFRDIGEVLSAPALRSTLVGLRALDDGAHLLPATLALVTVLEADEDATDERVRLLVSAAALHHSEDDEDAAEHALREAMDLDSTHPVARDELAGLLVRQGRLEALADVDLGLVAQAATRASDIGDQEMEIRALRVLASRRLGRERADTLVLVAALEKARGHLQAAEDDLIRAVQQAPEHGLARSELESIYWASQRYQQAVEVLGAQDFLQRAALLVDSEPELLLKAVDAVHEALDDSARAEAFELCGAVRIESVVAEKDWSRRVEAMEQAKTIWDTLKDHAGSIRSRIVLVDLVREQDDVDALLVRLQDALTCAQEPEARAALIMERATLLVLTDARAEARELVQALVIDEAAPLDHRRAAARMLVEDLLSSDVDELEPEDLELRGSALAVLTGPGAETGPVTATRLQGLAEIKEANGEDSKEIALLLERALEHSVEAEQLLQIRAQLRGLYEETGDWGGAERHASVIAKTQSDPDLWVQVSELRVWLDDRKGAEAALETALKEDPGHHPAHESLLRLAEQSGQRDSVLARLETWVDSDKDGDLEGRLQRTLRAQALAVEAKDELKALKLGERAVDLAEGDQVVEVVEAVCAVLEKMGALEGQVSLLARVVSGTKRVPVHLRLMLVGRLEALGRQDEARTVLEAGIHRDSTAADPLVQQLLRDIEREPDDRAARRLFAISERLGTGPTARRLAALGAQRAEAGGDRALARTGWSTVLTEVGGAEGAADARTALVRIARAEGDDSALLSALLESIDDAPTPEEKAAQLAEAADLAASGLQTPAQAEALYRRAKKLAPDDAALAERFIGHLRTHERWSAVDVELRERVSGAQGEPRAQLCETRAEVADKNLKDALKAARLRVEAYEAAPNSHRARRAVESLHRAGAPDEALELAQEVLGEVSAEDPERGPLERLRCDLLESLGRIDEVVDTLSRDLGTHSAPAWAQPRLQNLLVKHKRYSALAELLMKVAPDLSPGEGLRTQLSAARILLEKDNDGPKTRAALEGALQMVEAWLGAPGAPLPDDIAPPPMGGQLSQRLSFEAPLLDLASLSSAIEAADLRVRALRLYAQSLAEGRAQRRVLLMLGGAEREAGDLDAAEFTLRGVVDAVRDVTDVDAGDRAEAERALGVLLLDRGDAAGAVEALSRAEALLRAQSADADLERAEVLLHLGTAHRRAGNARAAMEALMQAKLLDPDCVGAEQIDEAVAAAGPGPHLAELMVRRAAKVMTPSERAAQFRAAAGVWESIGQPSRAYHPLIQAYEADPSNSSEASRLEELLYDAERWQDLEHLFQCRLQGEDLTDEGRRTLQVAQARLLESQLDRPQDALVLLTQATEGAPKPAILQELARLAAALDMVEVEQDALARLASIADAPEVRRAALLANAKTTRPEVAVAALGDAVDLSLEEGFAVTALAERLSLLYAERGDYASVARLWVRVAGARDGAGAAAAFARAGQVRLDKLEDRRGAASAFEAACRRAPDDLGLRRAALSLAQSLGDRRRAEAHARTGAEVAMAQGRPAAAVSFARAQTLALAASGQYEAEIEVWQGLLRMRPSRAALDALVVRAREALPAERVDVLLSEASEAAAMDADKAQMLLARARVLDDPLGRHWEAEGLREDASKLDSDSVQPGDAARTPSTQDLSDADYRTMRSMLDRSGRWSELADLEEAHAQRLGSRAERARALLEVARLHISAGTEASTAKAQEVLQQGVQLDPGLVEAHAALVRLQVKALAWSAAAETLERLDELGGPPWPVPEAELLTAEVAMACDDPTRAKAALVQGLSRDPHSVEVKARLAKIDPSPARLQAWAAVLDPVLDAETLAEVSVAQAEAALQASDARSALTHVDAALRCVPRSPRARKVRRQVLEASRAAPMTLVDALRDEAQTSDPEAASLCLQEALRIATHFGLHDAAQDVAEALGGLNPSDPEVVANVAAYWRSRGEGRGLIQASDLLGGIDQLQDLSEQERVRLGRALFGADRDEEAWKLLLHGSADGSRDELAQAWQLGELEPLSQRLALALVTEDATPGAPGGDGLARPEVRAQLRARFLNTEEELGPYALGALTRCVVLLPHERGLAELLARTLKAMDCVEDAAVEYRALLLRDPGSQPLLEALLEVLSFDDSRGPRAAQDWLQAGATASSQLPYLVAPLSDLQMLGLQPQSPLAEILQLSAAAMGKVLQPTYERPEKCWPASKDPRIAEIWSKVQDILPVDIEAFVDAEGGARMRIEPGERLSIAVGEALLEQATDLELQFRMARAAYLICSGYLLVEHAPGRTEVLGMLADVCEGVPHEGGEALAEHIDPVDRDRLADLAPALRTATDFDVASWRVGVLGAASRFGLLVCGNLGAALASLDDIEPRALCESRSTELARQAALRRWGPLADLLTWLTQADFAELSGHGNFNEDDSGF